MCLQTIGESLKSIDRMMGEDNIFVEYPSIPWHQIFGLRNIISHEYASVDVDEIYNIIKNDLNPLSQIVEQIMKDLKQ